MSFMVGLMGIEPTAFPTPRERAADAPQPGLVSARRKSRPIPEIRQGSMKRKDPAEEGMIWRVKSCGLPHGLRRATGSGGRASENPVLGCPEGVFPRSYR